MNKLISSVVFVMCSSGVVFAQGAPAKADPAKPATTPATPAKTEPAKMEMPKAPAEIADMMKLAGGNWKCKGDMAGQGGGTTPITATVKSKVELDKWWIVDTIEVKGAMPMKMLAYKTYDATSKKWRQVAVDNYGSQMIGTSDGVKDGKLVWTLDTMGPMGAHVFKDSMDATDMKAGVKFSGEMSMDKGKTWMKVYDMVCKK